MKRRIFTPIYTQIYAKTLLFTGFLMLIARGPHSNNNMCCCVCLVYTLYTVVLYKVINMLFNKYNLQLVVYQ